MGPEDPLEKEMAPHSGFLDCEISWTEKHGGLRGSWGYRVNHNSATKPPITTIKEMRRESLKTQVLRQKVGERQCPDPGEESR